MNCLMCQPPKEHGIYFIKNYSLWRVELHGNQCYLGRCVVVLKRHLEDMLDINEAEKKELFSIGKKLRDALRISFRPDLVNYSFLGNEIRHVHLHMIPRYKKQVEFGGVTFVDKRWGKNPSPYDKDFKASDKIHRQLVEVISSRMS